MSLNDSGYVVIRNIIPKELCDVLYLDFSLIEKLRQDGAPEDVLGGEWVDDKLDTMSISNCFQKYCHSSIESLSFFLLPKISEISNKELVPTYTYNRIYKNGAELSKHIDRPACEYSVSVCLYSDGTDWPIYMEETPITLNIGDAVVYKGMEVLHERKKYAGKEHHQAFLHYVDKNGPHASWKYDKKPFVGYPVTFVDYPEEHKTK
jgi:hypothetical protein